MIWTLVMVDLEVEDGVDKVVDRALEDGQDDDALGGTISTPGK